MLTWKWRTFDELSTSELYNVLALREEVFILEQKCVYTDLDYNDQKAIHLLGYKNNKLAAYLRLFLPGTKYPDKISFGRVLTSSYARGEGAGKALIDETLLYLKKNKIRTPIIISAQQYLEKFYQSYGFETISEPYDDAGVMHIDMQRPADDEKK